MNKRGREEPGGVAYLRAGEINRGIPRLLGCAVVVLCHSHSLRAIEDT